MAANVTADVLIFLMRPHDNGNCDVAALLVSHSGVLGN